MIGRFKHKLDPFSMFSLNCGKELATQYCKGKALSRAAKRSSCPSVELLNGYSLLWSTVVDGTFLSLEHFAMLVNNTLPLRLALKLDTGRGVEMEEMGL